MEKLERINLGPEGFNGKFIVIEHSVKVKDVVTVNSMLIRVLTDTQGCIYPSHKWIFQREFVNEVRSLFPEARWVNDRMERLVVGEHRFTIQGGGTVSRDEKSKRINLYGESHAYGPCPRESVPVLTELLQRKFPEYEIVFDNCRKR